MSQPPDTAHKVIEQIESRRVAMRPRWQFVVAGAAGAVGLVATMIVLVYVVNLLVFKLRLEVSDRPMYGAMSNLGYYSGHFPWLALLVSLAGLGLLFWLVRRFDFAYRIGRWTVLFVLLFSVVVGTALAFTNFNSHIETMGPFQHFYEPHTMQQNQNQHQNGPQPEPHGMMGPHGQPD